MKLKYYRCIFCKDVYTPQELQGLECPWCGDSIGWEDMIVYATSKDEALEKSGFPPYVKNPDGTLYTGPITPEKRRFFK